MIPVLPTSYFGSIAWFRRLVEFKSVLIEAKEHFPKQSYRNRCDIVGSEGIISLTVPVTKPQGTKTPTEEILLSNHEDWRIRHWRSIQAAYQSAPFFEYYGPEVHDLLNEPHERLIDLNMTISRRIIQWLDLPVELRPSESFAPMTENDDRLVLVHKTSFQETETAPYIQVFPEPEHFRLSVSILDAIFCEGPMARNLLFTTDE